MPTNMSIGELTQPGVNAQANSGLGNAVNEAGKLATTMQDLQSRQQQQQQMQDQLDSAKYQTVMGTTQTAMRMSDPIFKVSEKAMEKRLQQVNPDYQPGTLAALRCVPAI